MSTVYQLPTGTTYSAKDAFKISGGIATPWKGDITFFIPIGALTGFLGVVSGVTDQYGNPTPVSIATSYANISVYVSLQHPLYGGMYARTVECEAFGTPSANNKLGTDVSLTSMYSNIKALVHFETPTYQTSGDQAYMSIRRTLNAAYTTIPGRKFSFPSSEPIDADAGTAVNKVAFDITLHQRANVNDAIFNSLTMCVNSATFLGDPAGVWLFKGREEEQTNQNSGQIVYQSVLHFEYDGNGWNNAFTRAGALATPLDPAGNPQYTPGDLNYLLG